jgi:hypothetical protein
MHLKIILLWLDINHFTSGVVIIGFQRMSSHLLKVPIGFGEAIPIVSQEG